MTGKSRLANLQCVYQLAHAHSPRRSNTRGRESDTIAAQKSIKVSHYLLYIGILRYIKRRYNAFLGMTPHEMVIRRERKVVGVGNCDVQVDVTAGFALPHSV